MKGIIKEAISSGLTIVNGLHQFLGDNAEFKILADQNGVEIIDIRRPKPKDQLHFWTGRIKEVPSPCIAVLGTDCNVGKRTTTRYLTESCKKAGIHAEMIYTGQTGWMQGARYGFIFDSTYNDFISGELEHAIVTCYEEARPEVIFLEGQSDLLNPSGPCGSEFLLSGGASTVILQHAPARVYYHGCEPLGLEIPPIEKFIKLIELYGSNVMAISINTQGLNLGEAVTFKELYQKAFNIPVVLPLEEGTHHLIPAIKDHITGYRKYNVY